jgi:hypothetical protein
MITQILHAAHRANRWLDQRFGPSYRVILAVGLSIEIGHHIREIVRATGETEHVVRSLLVIVVGAALLVNTLGELYERLARRKMRQR